MCQLLGMNSAQPADMRFSFTGFAQRGGATDHHGDGFGIGFFEDKVCRLFIDNQPAASSPVADLIKHYPIKSKNVISHIRKATQGDALQLQNCHPFVRELCGRHWLFAHNGDLIDYAPVPSKRYQPIGETDSERAFCELMDAIINIEDGHGACPEALTFATIARVAERIAEHGVFNFLLSNGKFMVVHCSTNLYLLQRQWPFAEAQLIDADMRMDFSQTNTAEDRIAVVATQPLTSGENWRKLEAGELLLLKDGQIVQETRLFVSDAVKAKNAANLACV
jgi:predicted glutamine amidotransferase